MIKGIGINCHDDMIDGHLDRLERDLANAQSAGFDAYELSLEATNVIRAGRVHRGELERVKSVLQSYPLRYTVHPPCSLRLTDRTGFAEQVFMSCLDVCAAIGAEVMVYHSAQIALRSADHDISTALLDAAARSEMWRFETQELKRIAPQAAGMGVVIAVENRDPHLWEVAALARHGKAASDLLTYHQGMRLDLLAKQVEEIGSPNVGICLDVGHAFLAAPYWPEPDYLSAIRQAAPWIRHLHLHDNFGRLDDWAGSMRERLVFGEADNHMPPGWGQIPLADVLSILERAGYSGWLVVELSSRYASLLPQVASQTRALAAGKELGFLPGARRPARATTGGHEAAYECRRGRVGRVPTRRKTPQNDGKEARHGSSLRQGLLAEGSGAANGLDGTSGGHPAARTGRRLGAGRASSAFAHRQRSKRNRPG